MFALYWNKDLFAEAGLDPERPPQTMEELVQYAQKLTRVDEDGKLTRMGFMPDFSRSHSDLYAHVLGGAWVDEDGTQVMVNPIPLIESLNWQAQFFEGIDDRELNKFALSVNGFINSKHPVFGGARLNCQQCHRAAPRNEDKIPDHSFYDGRVAMMVDGQWQVGAAYLPHFQPDLDYGVAPFPFPADHPERKNTSIVQGPVVMIPAAAVDQEMAANLLTWMVSPEIVVEIALANGMLPTSRTAAGDARSQEIPFFGVFMDLLADPNAGYTAASPTSLDLNQAVQQVEKAVLHETGADAQALVGEVQKEFAP